MTGHPGPLGKSRCTPKSQPGPHQRKSPESPQSKRLIPPKKAERNTECDKNEADYQEEQRDLPWRQVLLLFSFICIQASLSEATANKLLPLIPKGSMSPYSDRGLYKRSSLPGVLYGIRKFLFISRIILYTEFFVFLNGHSELCFKYFHKLKFIIKTCKVT